MLRGLLVRCLWLGIVCAAASLVQAQDFSADLMDLSGPQPTAVGKIYAKGDKLRVERGASKEDGPHPVAILDMGTHSMIILESSAQVYMKSNMGADMGSSFFRLADGNNACGDLQKMTEMKADCKKSGKDTVNGRAAVKYEGKTQDGTQVTVWTDPELNFIVKWQVSGGDSGELRNIKVGTQDGKLFEVPSGYRDASSDASKSSGENQK
jgi:hypothetical protein